MKHKINGIMIGALVSVALVATTLAPTEGLSAQAAAHHVNEVNWNLLGWESYQKGQYANAIAAFQSQLRFSPGNPSAIWGLANCYGNSQVREYAKARSYLLQLHGTSEGVAASRMLKSLPPNNVDATFHPQQSVTYEDAIAIAMSYRIAVPTAGQRVVAQNGQAPGPSSAAYVSAAAAKGLLSGLTVPSFQSSATRLFLALFLAKLYGVNRFDYIRPFPLTDMASVPVDDQMIVNSILAMRIMTETGTDQFQPNGTMTRADFAAVVRRANLIMKHPPTSVTWLTPPAPARTQAELYLFRTSQPNIATQESDFNQHQSQIAGIAFTDFPLIADTSPQEATVRSRMDTTKFLFTPLSAGTGVTSEMAMATTDGIRPFMVLSNYSDVTDAANPQIVDQLLSDPSTSAALANEVIQIAKSEHLGGIAVDYENILAKDRSALVQFVDTLHQDLVGTGLQLMVCLPEQQSDSAATAFDYKALGSAADLVMLITYDEHTAKSAPGPITNWNDALRTVQYAVQVIPAKKILLGLADYGYDWSSGTGTQIDMANAYALAQKQQATIQWDAATGSSYFPYTDAAGARHTVFFESGKSLAKLAQLVPAYGLRGFAAWYLGGEDAHFWNALAPYLT